MANLLLIDDDVRFLGVLSKLLMTRSHSVTALDNGEAALAALESESFDLIICDIYMKPMSGMDVMKAIQAKQIRSAVILMTAYGTVDTAVEALNLGVFDYVTKPFDIAAFVKVVDRALAWRTGKVSPEDASIKLAYRIGSLVAESKCMRVACTMIERIALTDATVCFRGEAGVGKQSAARALHDLSRRANAPFLVCQCGGLTEAQLTAELFGLAVGAAPGVDVDLPGLLQQADGGTVLLSEFGTLPNPIQRRLLDLFKTKSISLVGGKTAVPVNVRILAQTTTDVTAAVSSGAFIAELLQRLATLSIEIKPLRERPEDVLPLCLHVLTGLAGTDGIPPQINHAAQIALLQYGWPGNIDELTAIMKEAYRSAGNNPITMDHLPEVVKSAVDDQQQTAATVTDFGRAQFLKEFLKEKNAEANRSSAAQAPN
ncbi:MAG: sigma-54 dependent transcriptional regulator [Verrucomicrobia bacterium]|nr:sigma-54 dependent transcriptional regulator [Verrucomicrobiota bacterium]